MQVREIMTKEPSCCTPDTALPEVARMMAKHDCGAIPVLENDDTKRPMGMITDRDITCRAVAEEANTAELTAADCMTAPVITVESHATLEECCTTMERNQVRRIPVVDDSGRCCGIVAQADIARHAPMGKTAEVVQQISEPLQPMGT
jgi:CBS domain-containing protein